MLRRRSGGVNVSRVVSGIRCHRSGLLWRLCRHPSWFHNVRVLACTGRPYSGERCCSSAITLERNSLVRRDPLLREQLSVRTAPQLSRAGSTACVVRPQRDFLPAIEARLLTSMIEARPFACSLCTPCAFVAADGGDHLPLCRYNAAFCADLGRHVDDRPKSRGAVAQPGGAWYCSACTAACNSG